MRGCQIHRVSHALQADVVSPAVRRHLGLSLQSLGRGFSTGAAVPSRLRLLCQCQQMPPQQWSR